MREFIVSGTDVILPVSPRRRNPVRLHFKLRLGHTNVALDGRAYVFAGAYDHEWTPYFSKSEQKHMDGCDTCGWSKDIHPPKPITHITCDMCEAVVPKDEAVVRQLDVLIPPRTLDIPPADFREGFAVTLPGHWQPFEHYFCSERCFEDRMFVL